MTTSKVALSIIAKDEEKTIATCIKSVLPYVDAVYVLDTGSTDKTVPLPIHVDFTGYLSRAAFPMLVLSVLYGKIQF